MAARPPLHLAMVVAGLLVIAMPAAAHPMLVGAAPWLPNGTEAVAVGSDQPWDLGGWSVSDGEGRIDLPTTHLEAGQPLWLVSNLSGWSGLQGFQPAQAWQATGPFQLANAGDGLQLVDPNGHAADTFAWGTATVPGMSGRLNRTSEGLVYLRDREPDWRDTDRADDWVTPREHRIGESSLTPRTFVVHHLTLYSSPDSSYGVLTRLIANATTRLHLHVYEFTSLALADAIVAAKNANPGLDLQVLVDRQPVGFTSPERHREAQALEAIRQAGGQVFLAGHGRYDDTHLKVLVADDQVAVQSENWVDAGMPADPTWGNRGWGAVATSSTLAGWFEGWMSADRAAWDTQPFDLHRFDPTFDAVPQSAPRNGAYGPVVPAADLVGDFTVTPLVAPDMTQDPRADPLAAIVRSARSRVDGQELDLATGAANALGWHSPDPLATALMDAAHDGVHVRVQAAAPFSSDDGGNTEAMTWLQARGVQASVLDRRGIATLHNKGLVADGTVVLGSLNANHHSRSANREVDLVLEGPGIAAWYRALADADAAGTQAPPDGSVIGKDLHAIPWAPLPSLLALAGVGRMLQVRR